MPHRPRTHRHRGVLALCLPALLAVAVSLGALSGCALLQPRPDSTKFYLLTPATVAAQAPPINPGAGLKIGLRAVEVPTYLRTKKMVVRAGRNEILYSEFDRWAEPLDEAIARVVKEALGSTDKVDRVALNSQGGDTLDYEVRIRVLACEGARGGGGADSIRLAMSWEIQPSGTNGAALKRGGFRAAPADWEGKDYARLAWQLGKGIGEAAQALAADLVAEARPPRKPGRE